LQNTIEDPFPLGNVAFRMKLRSLSNLMLIAVLNANINVGTAQADPPSYALLCDVNVQTLVAN
jgi:hypothetical protein